MQRIEVIDSHTGGEPTRVVIAGGPDLGTGPLAERREIFRREFDHVRSAIVNEPRGSDVLVGALVVPPQDATCAAGVIFFNNVGYLGMCGHGTIGVATVLVETGMVEVTEPVTTIRLDVPAGLVVAEVAVEHGEARSVTIRNVPSFAYGLDLDVDVPGIGRVAYDMAFGGNFYAIVESEALGVEFSRDNADAIKDAAMRLMAAINEADSPVHPTDPSIRGCKHVQVLAPGSTAQHSRHAMVISPGWFDRSPCGTGTSARMAQLHARGELPLDTDFINESFIGTHFVGRLVEETVVGDIPAVVPTITGRAWITATAQYMLSDDDPFPAGFLL